MLVNIRNCRYGCISVDPVNTRIKNRIIKDIRKNGGYVNEHDSLLFLQGDDVECFLSEYARRHDREYDSRVRIDDWDFRQMCGYSDQ